MPLRRYIFNTLTVVSLLLLLATVGLWVDGYWQAIWGTEELELRSSPGNDDYRFQWKLEEMDMDSVVRPSRSRSDNTSYTDITYSDYGFVIPHWFLTLIFATLPGIWLFKWNKRRKLGPNACVGCGYDLTGNESGVCPECGVAASG